MKNAIPDKLYFKIGEVAKLTQVPPHVLRYWESEFPEIKPKRAYSKQRLFQKSDIELILKVKELLHSQGYTIAGAKNILNGKRESPTTGGESGGTSNGNLRLKLRFLKQELHFIKNLLKAKKEK